MELPPRYNPNEVEEKIYRFWEKSGFFNPDKLPQPRKKTFSILLPLPNANAPLHMGHALFVIQDILIRYHRMKGDKTLWLPGGDHAGIETQFVFEKKLAQQNKSRFDFDRKTLYQMIHQYVEENKHINIEQLKKMGFSLDWSRYRYSLEPQIIKTVKETFKKLYQDGLIYRGEKIVNFCTHCGTAFSDLEVDYIEREDFLYFLDYKTIRIATTRPETIFADVAVAVNPKDQRYKKLIGKKAKIPLIEKEIPIIADSIIDPSFGTGALKVTPGHDKTDFEIGQRHQLPILTIINREGKLINVPTRYLGLTIEEGRKKIIEDLKNSKKLIKSQPLKHSVGVCYRCKSIIQHLTMPQWFVKIKPLAKPAIQAIKTGKTKVIPEKPFKKMYLDWMTNIKDWNISRQIVWGPQIPVWYCLQCNPDIFVSFITHDGKKINAPFKDIKEKYNLEEIKNGLQSIIAPKDAFYFLEEKKCPRCSSTEIIQETDTFDTWFLSGQWPLTALGYPNSKDFKTFYPTSVLDTMWDILFFWVARMMMFGLYLTKKVPFRIIHLHCRVVDQYGRKMSKSKNNVIDPILMSEKYGTDALRFALVFGSAPASDIHISEEKIKGMRNFATKIWNAARFVLSCQNENKSRKQQKTKRNKEDQWILTKTKEIVKKTTRYIELYRFDLAAQELYHFFWHTFCDKYIEMSKKRREEAQPTLLKVLEISLKLLHPFMPFLTEELYQKLPLNNKKKKLPLMIESWPTQNDFY